MKITARALKDMGREAWPELTDAETRLSIDIARTVIATLSAQIERLEARLLARVKLAPEFRQLLSVSGIGPILALTIMLEVGDIRRFPSVGQFASYCRCVDQPPMGGTERFRQIFVASRFATSECRGTASTAPVCGLVQRECEPPSRLR